jgi:hypothetical protein
MHSRCFGVMEAMENFAFNLVVKLSVELGMIGPHVRHFIDGNHNVQR